MRSLTPTQLEGPDHAVAFYEEEGRLVEAVATFARVGLEANEAVVIIATPQHRAAVLQALGALGAQAEQDGRLILEDAAQTISTFQVSGMPDPQQFTRLLDRLWARAGARTVRAFGEMMNLLWQGGQRAAALRLEELWCDAVKQRSFPLLCAYLLDGFASAEDATAFRAVCAHHSKVRPVTRFEPGEPDRNLRLIAELEQRARSLQTEVARRMALPIQPAAEVAGGQAPQPDPVRRRVLLIDDNEDIRETLREVLEDLGHEVQVAVDGPSGIKKLLQMQPDLALVDVGLPGFDGYEVARQARAASEGRGLYLIALTGYSGSDARRQAEQAGFDRHLVKPLKLEELAGLMQLPPLGGRALVH